MPLGGTRAASYEARRGSRSNMEDAVIAVRVLRLKMSPPRKIVHGSFADAVRCVQETCRGTKPKRHFPGDSLHGDRGLESLLKEAKV